MIKAKKAKTTVLTFALLHLIWSANLVAETKVDRNVSYGPHPRNVMDIYWNTDHTNAPIVFTIHGGGFMGGDKSYCNDDMQQLYLAKGCIVVSPNYRLVKAGTNVTKDDCSLDAAMAVAYMQANAAKYHGDATKIVATGASAGGYISACIAYQKKWEWPGDARFKPEKLNIVGWFGNSPFLPPALISQVSKGDPPGFIMYGGKREHPATPATQGHDIQAALKKNRSWNQMVYIDFMGHVPAKRILFNPETRDQETYDAFNQFLDLVCYGTGNPQGGNVISVKRN